MEEIKYLSILNTVNRLSFNPLDALPTSDIISLLYTMCLESLSVGHKDTVFGDAAYRAIKDIGLTLE